MVKVELKRVTVLLEVQGNVPQVGVVALFEHIDLVRPLLLLLEWLALQLLSYHCLLSSLLYRNLLNHNFTLLRLTPRSIWRHQGLGLRH